MKKFLIIFLFTYSFISAQTLNSVNLEHDNGLSISVVNVDDIMIKLKKDKPLFTFEIDGEKISSYQLSYVGKDTAINLMYNDKLVFRIKENKKYSNTFNYSVKIENVSNDTLQIENMVPFGASNEHIYISSDGPWSLARSKIFRPGLGPIGVIIPDNAWELGYASVETETDDLYVTATARRKTVDKATKRRYNTLLPPNSAVYYNIYFDAFSGIWQNGLNRVFHEKYLYDLEEFDNTLFEREDLKWIRNEYLISCTYAWDHNYFDRNDNSYRYSEYLSLGKNYFGGFDIFILWPTWPTLGLDPRNQWNLYFDLPGGMNKLNELSKYSKSVGTKFFVSYNPWDLSTDNQDHFGGMSRIIKAIDADGVVLDTYGWSTLDLQYAADSVKKGVVMYSEGMAVTKDMPGIVSGRVHDAIYLPPPLNLNKVIKPEFAIFRVLQLSQGRLHRETSISFFNGYGVEINTFAPGRPDWMDEEYLYLGKTTKLLRENSNIFLNDKWIPLIPTLKDSIWVNKWMNEDKTLYTIYSLLPEGLNEPLFEVETSEGYHYIDLWHHDNLTVRKINDKNYAVVDVNAFDKSWLGTRREGNIGCIVKFQELLKTNLSGDILEIEALRGDSILVWAGNPTYQKNYSRFDIKNQSISLREHFFRFEGKFVIQLFKDDQLIDEIVEYIEPGTPRLISKVVKTELSEKAPKDMIEIPAGILKFKTDHGEKFIPYPEPENRIVKVDKFFIDVYPVTNNKFKEFIDATNYQPSDTSNYLKHWNGSTFPDSLANHPVVYISIEDAHAFSKWAGKRLPTETEWQFAGQGNDTLYYPWGNELDTTKCNNALGRTTPVNKFDDAQSKYGVKDMIGNIWQLTNDVYDNGAYNFVMMKGGSFYKPTASWWYVRGGPQPLYYRQILLQVSQGFERNSTVGFRCVKDAK